MTSWNCSIWACRPSVVVTTIFIRVYAAELRNFRLASTLPALAALHMCVMNGSSRSTR